MFLIDSIIFDLDGTLWNASKSSAIGWTKGLQQLGSTQCISKEQIESVAGKPNNVCLKEIIEDFGVDFVKIEETLDIMEKKAIQEFGGDLYPNFFDTITQLNQKKRLFLISNCQEWYLDLFLSMTNTKNIFVDYDCHGISKFEKSKMIKKMKNKHSLANPIYVGDTIGDYMACIDSQIKFIHARYGFYTNEIENTDYITELKQLISLIK